MARDSFVSQLLYIMLLRLSLSLINVWELMFIYLHKNKGKKYTLHLLRFETVLKVWYIYIFLANLMKKREVFEKILYRFYFL